MTVHPARSVAECELYLALRVCACGATGHRWSTLRRGADTVVYAGRCPSCDAPWAVCFRLPDDGPGGPGGPDVHAYGGREPSAVIDPGQYLEVATRAAAAAVAPYWAGADTVDVAALAAAASDAVAALDEVRKFLPERGDRIPEEAFTSTPGRAAFACHPQRFTRSWLDNQIQVYREALPILPAGDIDASRR